MAYRKEDLPPDCIASYDEGYKIAKDGGWLDDPLPTESTKEALMRALAKQIGFIDGLRAKGRH